MSTKTNFSKKKEHTPVVGDVRIRTHGLHIHEYTLHIHEYTETSPALFPERTARKVWLRAIAGASSGAHIHTSVVVYTRLNPTTFRTKGTLKKTVASVGGLARRHASRRLDARRQTDTRASLRSIPTIMAPMAEKTFNVDVDRCVMRVARARDRDRDRASASID